MGKDPNHQPITVTPCLSYEYIYCLSYIPKYNSKVDNPSKALIIVLLLMQKQRTTRNPGLELPKTSDGHIMNSLKAIVYMHAEVLAREEKTESKETEKEKF